MDKIEQPKWCNYPDAPRPVLGCWSLLDGLVENEDFCKDCELYYKPKKHKNDECI